MKKYEIMYILTATLDDAARKDEITKLSDVLTKQGGKVLDVNEWGLRDFAGSIKKQKKGYYVILKVEAEPNCLNEFTRIAKLDSNVIRHLITVANE